MSIMPLLVLLVPTFEGAAEPSGCQFSTCLKNDSHQIIKGTIEQHLVANYG